MLSDNPGILDRGGRKNLIINGDMRVAQRGTSFAGLGATTGYSMDRWQHTESGAPTGRFTLTQNAETTLDFSNCLKVDVTTADVSLAASALYYIRHLIEAQDLQHLKYGQAGAKTLTLSFWINSTVTGDYQVNLVVPDGSRSYSQTYNIASASTWEYKTLTFAGDTGGTINDDIGLGFDLNFVLAAGSNFTGGTEDAWAATANNQYGAGMSNNLFAADTGDWRLTGVQLEIGEVATDFEHQRIREQLADCYRYYYRMKDIDAGIRVCQGHVITTSSARGMVYTPEVMRGNETSRLNGTVGFSSQTHFSVREVNTAIAGTSMSGSHHTGNAYQIICGSSTAFTAGVAMNIESDTANAFIEFESEL